MRMLCSLDGSKVLRQIECCYGSVDRVLLQHAPCLRALVCADACSSYYSCTCGTIIAASATCNIAAASFRRYRVVQGESDSRFECTQVHAQLYCSCTIHVDLVGSYHSCRTNSTSTFNACRSIRIPAEHADIAVHVLIDS